MTPMVWNVEHGRRGFSTGSPAPYRGTLGLAESLGPGFYCCDFAEFGERGESGSVVNAECAMRNQCR